MSLLVSTSLSDMNDPITLKPNHRNPSTKLLIFFISFRLRFRSARERERERKKSKMT